MKKGQSKNDDFRDIEAIMKREEELKRLTGVDSKKKKSADNPKTSIKISSRSNREEMERAEKRTLEKIAQEISNS